MSTQTWTQPVLLPPCKRCGHHADWHRLDDSLNLSPADEDTPFRCLGPHFVGCINSCPDYLEGFRP